jgi:hypothetical protein
MRRRAVGLLAVVGWTLLMAQTALPCTVEISSTPLDMTKSMVASANLIMRVTAVAYAGAPPGPIRTTGLPDTDVRFTVDEIVKGVYEKQDITLPGYLSESDDWNDQTSPYTFVRKNGRSGSCFANTYRTGGSFLLVLQRTTPGSAPANRRGDGYTVNWLALAPTNEQLRSPQDPWIQWVREQTKSNY